MLLNCINLESVKLISALLFLNTICAVGFFLIYAGPGLGYGHIISENLRQHKDLTEELLIGTLALMIMTYILDVLYWKDTLLKIIKGIIILSICAGITIASLFVWSSYPAIPVALFIVSVPINIYILKYLFFSKIESSKFLHYIGLCLIVISVGMFIPWIEWVVNDYGWNNNTKTEFADLMNCDVPDECQAGYILWVSPLIATVSAFIFGWLAILLGHFLESENPSTIMAKIFIITIVLSILSIWVSASIAGSNMQLATSINILVIASIMLMTAIIIETFGWQSIQKELLKIAIVKKASIAITSEWAKAFMLVFVMPIIPFFLILSFIRHNVRKVWKFGKPMDKDDMKEKILGRKAIKQINKMKHWNWTSILVKMMWISIIYLTIFVGIGKMVTIFMSWLNGELESFSLGVVVVLFLIVGITMFLLPPVPGVPVYLAGGIIIVAKGQDTLSYWGAIAFMVGLGFILKMMAIVMQQKLIGEQLGKYVYIRELVGINSRTVKTIRLILQQKGLKLNKVSILIGGPDWPTSVLTGILKLDVFDMLYSSSPVIILIAPCVIAAAFFLKEDESWKVAGTIALTVAGAVQFISMLIAAYYLEKFGNEHQDEIDNIPDDEEVKIRNEKAIYGRYIKKQVTHWLPQTYPTVWNIIDEWQNKKISILMKINLVWGAFCGCISCYIALFIGQKSFETFEVTDTIDDKLDGNVWNVVKMPLGWICIGFLGGNILSLIIHGRWAKYRFNTFIENNNIDIDNPPDDWNLEIDEDSDNDLDEEDDIEMSYV